MSVNDCSTLRSNAITEILATDFQNFTSLEDLYVHVYYYIMQYVVIKLYDLRDLDNNRLTTIEPGSFDNNRMLQTL